MAAERRSTLAKEPFCVICLCGAIPATFGRGPCLVGMALRDWKNGLYGEERCKGLGGISVSLREIKRRTQIRM